MDEHTLNDLLECSVCLERLDTSSKVLPCQHTFCRKCLEVIVSSHNELRCPECRILVDIKIDELPPNVLLMRILEGMKHAAATANKALQIDNKLEEKQISNEQLRNQHQKQQQLQQQTQSPPLQQQQQNHHQPRRCLLPHAYALFDFITTEPTDLNFKKGDLILLKRRVDNNWYVGQHNGKEGTFPINYVQVIVPLPTPQCIALYDFKMGPNEEEGCLNFKKGTVIHVLRRVDPNWAEGRIGTTIGIFPIAFVELNGLAKLLLENYAITNIAQTPQLQQKAAANQQPQLNAHVTVTDVRSTSTQQTIRTLPPMPTLDPTESSSSTSTSNGTSPNSNSAGSSTSSSSNCSPHQSLPNTPQHRSVGHSSVRYRDKGAKEKRHSLNALISASSNGQTPVLSLMQTNRHSAEILSLPHELNIIANSTQNIQTERSELTETELLQHSTAQASVGQTGNTQPLSHSSSKATTTRVNVLKSGVQQNVPPTLPWGYLALYPYKPRKSDELELKKGCVYIVTERCLDGWFKGKNWQDICGVFPGNYVTPLRTRDQQQLMHQWKFVPQACTSNTSILTNCSPEQTTNMKISTLLPHQPPDLPPRQIVTQSTSNSATTTCSVWTKPLGQTVEAFFNRNKSVGSTVPNGSAQHSDAKDKQDQLREVHNTSSYLSGTATVASSGAVSLMKRLTNIKSRSKSPGAQLHQQQQPHNRSQQASDISIGDECNPITQLHPVHVRSGSCPSQLLQSLPNDTPVTQRTEHVPIQQVNNSSSNVSYGSQRIKKNKDRPHLVCARQSLDAATFRNMYNSNTTSLMSGPAGVYTQQHITLQSEHNLPIQMNGNQMITPTHRKSHSLDAGNMLNTSGSAGSSVCVGNTMSTSAIVAPASCSVTEAAIKASATTKSSQCMRESRFRCVVPYPPNSDIELELHVGDIIYVQRKQKNGWYKGTHARTNKTGLFPASFVEPDI